MRLRQRADAGAGSLWVEGRRPVLDDVEVRAGVRANLFSHGLGNSLSPRLDLDWRLSDDVRLSGSYGRFHQLVVTVDTELPIENTVVTLDDGRVFGQVLSGVGAARSTHLVLGVTHQTRPRALVRVETYWKTSRGVPGFHDAALRNAGLDVTASRPLAPGLTVWGAYTLGWSWADYPDAPSETVYGGRHFLRGGLTFDAPGEVRFDADVSMGQGLEFGAVPRSERTVLAADEPDGADGADGESGAWRGPGAPGVAGVGGAYASRGPLDGSGPVFTRSPDRSYLRLNVQATGELDVRIFGRDQQILPYFRIVNALDRRDALFFRYDGGENEEPRAIGSVPILPVVGLEWRL